MFKHPRHWLYFSVVIFFSGFIAGGIAGLVLPRVFGPGFPFGPPGPPSPEKFRDRLCSKIAEELCLSAAQKEDFVRKLEPKLSAFSGEHKQFRTRMSAIIDGAVMEIQPPLDEKQRQLFEEAKKKREAFHKREDSERGGPPPPPPPDKRPQDAPKQ
jgi:hypothetical protein